MKNKKRGFTLSRHPALDSGSRRSIEGFTLIELLIVVLIIGILAAIAVPQYQKAVLKSRFASLVPLAKTLNESNEAYYLEHGSYATDKSKLDVTTNDTKVQVTLGNEANHQYVLLTRGDIKNNLRMYQKHSPNFAGETHCEALLDNTMANWLCKESLKGEFVGNKYGYAVYSLDEETVGTLGRTYYNGKNGKNYVTYTEGDICIATSSRKCNGGAFYDSTCISSATYGCDSGVKLFRSTCEARSGTAACRGVVADDHSTCKSFGGATCYWATFKNYSKCTGVHCGGNNYTDHSTCEPTTSGACNSFEAYGRGPSYYTAYSSCVGKYANSCKGQNVFSDHSMCEARVSGACSGATYDTTSFCAGSCPTGTPKGTWSETEQAYVSDGWNGGCCKASMMIGGECPSGVTVCGA